MLLLLLLLLLLILILLLFSNLIPTDSRQIIIPCSSSRGALIEETNKLFKILKLAFGAILRYKKLFSWLISARLGLCFSRPSGASGYKITYNYWLGLKSALDNFVLYILIMEKNMIVVVRKLFRVINFNLLNENVQFRIWRFRTDKLGPFFGQNLRIEIKKFSSTMLVCIKTRPSSFTGAPSVAPSRTCYSLFASAGMSSRSVVSISVGSAASAGSMPASAQSNILFWIEWSVPNRRSAVGKSLLLKNYIHKIR